MTYAQLQRPTEAIAAAEEALRLARSQDRASLAQHVEAWLKDYRLQQANPLRP